MKNLLACLLAVLTLLCLIPPLGAAEPPLSIAGDWQGALDAGGATLHLVFHVAAKPDGTLSATFDSVEQGAKGIPFSAARVSGNLVHLEVAKLSAVFDGVLDAKATTISGVWVQGGNTLPLSISKGSVVAAEAASPPVPYAVRDVIFPGGEPGVRLAGTLTTPKGAGPFPVTVLIAGSGPNDRDETILGHKPFALLADTLTRRGVAVLRYDKRGIAQSTGSYATATTADFAADAEAAVSFLKTQSSIDPKRIGLMGHSEGGLIAPLVASRNREIAFVVLLAGPGMTGEQIMLAQGVLIAKAAGVPEADIQKNTQMQKALFEIAKRTPDSKAAALEAEALIEKSIQAISPEKQKAIGGTAFAKTQSQIVSAPWLRYFITYDPIPALRATRCPVLALGGSLDLQVPPKEDLAAIAAALKAGGNRNATVKELPGLNHLFQTCTTGSPSEYAAITETMAPIALTTIGDWIVAQTHAAAP